jgi:hypothetical protein
VSLEQLVPYCGIWEGKGVAEFPVPDPTGEGATVRRFRYRERLTLFHDAERGFIRVELLAWRTVFGSEVESASHHEVGAIAQSGDSLIMSTIQNGTRYERLRGSASVDAGRLGIDFESEAYANDPRVVSSWRRWRLSGDTLEYEMSIQPATGASRLPHLKASLHRVGS